MWPSTQEDYTHEIPESVTAKHPIASEARISLTYRHYDPFFSSFVPNCACSKRCVVKVRRNTKDISKKYYYACDTVGDSKPCSFFEYVPDKWRSRFYERSKLVEVIHHDMQSAKEIEVSNGKAKSLRSYFHVPSKS